MKKRLIFISLILVFALSLCLTGCGDDSADSGADSGAILELSQTFTGEGAGYTINYPSDWIYQQTNEYTIIFSGAEGTDAYYSTVNVQGLAGASMGGEYTDINSVYEDLKLQIEGVEGTINNMSEGVFAGQNGIDFTAEYTLNGEDFLQWTVVIPGSADMFFMYSYTGTPDIYDTYLPIAQAMMKTWTIE